MTVDFVDTTLVTIALDRVSGDPFEAFAQEFFSAMRGTDYVPLGGMHDGGAEGYVSKIEVAGGNPKHFMQASVQQDFRKKIRATVKRLRQKGRDPEALTYLTSLVIRSIDDEESALGKELGVSLRIRDRNYIANHINDGPRTRASYWHHLESELAFLKSAGKAPILAHSEHVTSPEVFVFLRQELERREGNASLLDAVIDSLALYALEGTDPDKGVLRPIDVVRARIVEAVPSAEQIVSVERLRDRLQAMASKDHPGGRAVRWHQKEDVYALPHETRVRLESENAEDAALQIQVRDGFISRLAERFDGELDTPGTRRCADICMSVIAASFEREGLAFSHFLSRKPETASTATLEEMLDERVHESGTAPEKQTLMKEACMDALTGAFYASTEAERVYLSKLSRTYAILFTLQTDPKLVEFFQEMTGNFYLYVGSDIIVRALSERHLRHQDQMTRIMLRMAREAGATLVLAEPVLNEVLSHLRTSDSVFNMHFKDREPFLRPEITRHADKILIRAYFYAKFFPERHVALVDSWEAYIAQFVPYSDLQKPAGKADLRAYLMGEFGFQYEDGDTLEQFVIKERVAELAESFMEIKSHDVLAKNDALMTLAVYGRRQQHGESASATEFGYRTWWLTSESHILTACEDLIHSMEGKRFMMRPEFLLNFIALAPNAAQVRETYEKVFPSLQGLRLGKRMKESAFTELMKKVDEAAAMEDGRVQAEVSKIVDHLKGDFAKEYAQSLASTGSADMATAPGPPSSA